MRAVNARSQRFGRALRHDPPTPLPTIADIDAIVYRVWVETGHGTKHGLLVLAANDEQARVHAALRLAFEGQPPYPCVRVDAHPSDSQMSKDSILAFESILEFQNRQDAYKALHPEWEGVQ